MGFWEGETFWKMCSCDSSRGQHIWAKRSYQVRGGRRSSSLNWEHTCLQSSMWGTPTLFLKDRVLCRCRNSEEAKQKRMEKGSCDDLTLRTPLAISLPVPHQLDLALLSWLLLREASPSPLTLSLLASLARSSSSSLLLPTPSLLHLALLPYGLSQHFPGCRQAKAKLPAWHAHTSSCWSWLEREGRDWRHQKGLCRIDSQKRRHVAGGWRSGQPWHATLVGRSQPAPDTNLWHRKILKIYIVLMS